MRLTKKAVTKRIENIDPATVLEYLKHWDAITPTSMVDRYRRWLFSAVSPQTGWEQNVMYYRALTRIDWNTEEELREVIRGVGQGLYEAKTSACWGIRRAAWTAERAHRLLVNPYAVSEAAKVFAHPTTAGWRNPRWRAWRNKLRKLRNNSGRPMLPHCGLKVISFALEMCWPRECEAVAIDRHVARWYGVPDTAKLTDKLYLDLEDHWCQAVKRRQKDGTIFPSPIVRHILWDEEHGEPCTDYWSHIFEENNANFRSVGHAHQNATA